MSFKIYTKTGDSGQTSLIGGTRIPKSHIRIEAYGTVDELNSWIGVIRDHIPHHSDINLFLADIQDRLFTVGSSLACDPLKNQKMSIPDLKSEDITLLEKQMDEMDQSLPVLKNFVLPGGYPPASFCHVARCVCRRAERICDSVPQPFVRLPFYAFPIFTPSKQWSGKYLEKPGLGLLYCYTFCQISRLINITAPH
jgi:cob(I)alamin adenosyltransferase